jgi:hypothetical protein
MPSRWLGFLRVDFRTGLRVNQLRRVGRDTAGPSPYMKDTVDSVYGSSKGHSRFRCPTPALIHGNVRSNHPLDGRPHRKQHRGSSAMPQRHVSVLPCSPFEKLTHIHAGSSRLRLRMLALVNYCSHAEHRPESPEDLYDFNSQPLGYAVACQAVPIQFSQSLPFVERCRRHLCWRSADPFQCG